MDSKEEISDTDLCQRLERVKSYIQSSLIALGEKGSVKVKNSKGDYKESLTKELQSCLFQASFTVAIVSDFEKLHEELQYIKSLFDTKYHIYVIPTKRAHQKRLKLISRMDANGLAAVDWLSWKVPQ